MLKIKKTLGILLAVCFFMSVTAAAVSTNQQESNIPDCTPFNFDTKIMVFAGKICKQGILDLSLSIGGVKMSHVKVDLSKREYSNTLYVGAEKVQYSFYLVRSCLCSKGYVNGWFHTKKSWNKKITCL
jgi:hypothetical protein